MIVRTLRDYNIKSLALQREFEELKYRHEKILLETELEIQEQTFRYISMEIHDNITQALSLAKLNLNCLTQVNDSENIEKLAKANDLISKSMFDLTNLSRSLDSDIIESHGLISALKHEIARHIRINDIDVELIINGNTLFMDSKKELIVFRIVQEAFNNILKHAKASKAIIQIDQVKDSLEVTIRDNGIGFDYEKIYDQKKIGEMQGLKNMKHRAEHINGTIHIVSAPVAGTSITLKI
jgi:signal transduction histidine kinase